MTDALVSDTIFLGSKGEVDKGGLEKRGWCRRERVEWCRLVPKLDIGDSEWVG